MGGAKRHIDLRFQACPDTPATCARIHREDKTMTERTVPLPEPALTHDRHGAMLLIGPCFTADQLHAYGDARVAAERERWQARVQDAFREGFYASITHNDIVLNTADEAWEEAKAGLLKA